MIVEIKYRGFTVVKDEFWNLVAMKSRPDRSFKLEHVQVFVDGQEVPKPEGFDAE